ncbi:MAG: hypothetical protein KJ674_05045 [Nanoarchaeota archaeon]|nr:hypothetical protein [Nanoarchaeota archaeon]
MKILKETYELYTKTHFWNKWNFEKTYFDINDMWVDYIQIQLFRLYTIIDVKSKGNSKLIITLEDQNHKTSKIKIQSVLKPTEDLQGLVKEQLVF